MPLTPINVGTGPNDGTGDLLRNAFIKVNANDTYLDTEKASSTALAATNATVAQKLGRTETAAAATKLATPRAINGVLFDGTAPINIGVDMDAVTLSNYPNVRPSLLLDFANSGRMDSRVTFTRASPATFWNKRGVLEVAAANVPRINYDPLTGECVGYLNEEPRTNDVIQSEFATGLANGLYGNVTATTFPGFAGGVSIQYNAAGAYAYKTVTPSVQGTSYSFSFFLLMDDGGDASSSDFTVVLAGGAVANPTIKKLGAGLHLVQAAGLAGGVNTSYGVVKYANQSNRGFKVTGFDRQTGTFPTSYIPTTTAAATRAADYPQMLGSNFSDWYRQDEGTFVVEVQMLATGGFGVIGMTGGNGAVSRISIYQSGGAFYAFQVVESSATQVQANFSGVIAGGWNKLGAALKLNDSAAAGNGAAPVVDNTCIPPVMDTMNIGRAYGTGILSAHIKRIAYYPVRLTNAQLQALTAI